MEVLVGGILLVVTEKYEFNIIKKYQNCKNPKLFLNILAVEISMQRSQ